MNIWTLTINDESNIAPAILVAARALLSAEEITRVQHFVFDIDRNRFILAHALCRRMLSEFGLYKPAEWQFDKEPLGRPYISAAMDSTNLDFNLSHTKGMVGCAISDEGRVGLDLEPIDRQVNIVALAQKQFSVMEARDVLARSGADQRAQFFRYWTLKESYIKVTGRGLTESLANFGFDLSGVRPKCVVGCKVQSQFGFDLFNIGSKHQGAWAMKGKDSSCMEPQIRELTLEQFSELIA